MDDLRKSIVKAAEEGGSRLRERLAGKVRHGYCAYAPHVAVEIDEDDTETYGRFNEKGEFVPYTEEEYEDFDQKYRVWRTPIFDKKYENNVLQFRARKPTST